MSGGASVRTPAQREGGFTLVYNDQIPDPGVISARAFGLYVYLLSRPPHWEARVGHLQTVFREGRDAIYTALRELVDQGWATRESVIDSPGQPPRQVFTIVSHPPTIRAGQAPVTGNPDPGIPDPGNPPRINTDVQSRQNEANNLLPIAVAIGDTTPAVIETWDGHTVDEWFDLWWSHYPRKVGKPKARTAFLAAVKRGVHPAQISPG